MIKYILEIKNRLVLTVFSWLVTIIVCYYYKECLVFNITIQPNANVFIKKNYSEFPYFIITSVTEIFSTYITLILFLTLQIVIIYAIYHLFVFIKPALFKKEFFFFKMTLKSCFVFWMISVLLANFIIIPITWEFFLGFQELSKKSLNLFFEAKLDEFILLYIQMLYICIIYSQLFAFILIYGTFWEVMLHKNSRKFYYFCFVLIATAVSPPDITSQLSLSLIIILFFEFLLLILINRSLKTNWATN